MNKERIYLDYAATTPVDELVIDEMIPYFSNHFGNPSSIHAFGQHAEAALQNARNKISAILNCREDEIVFTSGGSESDNLALRGASLAQQRKNGSNHILISPVEHHAISHTAKHLETYHGFKVEYLPVDKYGIVNPKSVIKRIRPDTAVVSIIFANNEIGSINPIDKIGEICRSRNVIFHTDAVQAPAYLPIKVDKLNVDLLSLGAHKFYGPKGIGILYIRKGTPLISTQTGGGQEYGLRAGTSNIPYIVGMAKALRLAEERRSQLVQSVLPLRNRLIEYVLGTIPDVKLTGHPANRLPNHASFVFKNVDGNDLLMQLDMQGFACSSGSACKTGDPEPSDVLVSLGLEREWAFGSLRVTLGSSTKYQHITSFINVLPGLVNKARQLHVMKYPNITV